MALTRSACSGETTIIEQGESFVLTRNGTPIADLIPHARLAERQHVTGADLLAAADQLPMVDAGQFFADLDRYVDPDPLREPGESERPV
ncbi:MAG: type II toxin-antitoxin system prevent-host-death family antitoxin [Pseudonocardiaceae bacterium]